MMSANPSVKFYWNDWDNDPCLRVCSLAAQGLWMRCLCLMARARPAGYLLIGTRPCTVEKLAELVGKDQATVTALMDELGRNEVFATTRSGTVYNRRMVRESALSIKRAEAGRKGGRATVDRNRSKTPSDAFCFDSPAPGNSLPELENPRLLKQIAKQNSSKPQAPLVPSTLIDSESGANVVAYESDSQPDMSNVALAQKPKRRCTYPAEFEELWSVYPQRPTDSKKSAFAAWDRTVKSGVDPPTLQVGAKRYAAFVRRTGHESMLVQTWMNREGWTCSYAGNGSGHGKPGIVERVASRLRAEGKDLFGPDGPVVEGISQEWRGH
jgi:hypothetical protein